MLLLLCLPAACTALRPAPAERRELLLESPRPQLPALAVAVTSRRRARHERERRLATLQRGERPYRTQRSAPCTRFLLCANVATFALQLATSGRLTAAGCKPARPFRRPDWPRLFTPVFLHGSVAHLLVNSYSLQDLGPVVEGAFGSGRFVLMYALSGLAGNAASFALNTGVPSVGASGAIFGLVGAYAAFLAQNRQLLGSGSLRELQSLALMISLNLGMGAVSPQIDNYGHLGGLVGGALAGVAIGPRLRVGYSANPLMPRAAVVDRSLWPALTRRLERLGGGSGSYS